GENIRCKYDDNMYKSIHMLLEKRDSILNISGEITRDRKENKIESIKIERVRVNENAQYYKEGDLDRFFGCAPEITKGHTPREHIEKIRNEKQ
ncbi:MAG: hypothetical protein U9P14_03860, partial [Gemmatimonadota bacterium]|nr:hypothetical protein [Gemmatimonadota bacterium]